MEQTKIHNRFLDNITWQDPQSCDFKTGNTIVDVWRLNIETSLALTGNFISVMQPGELEKAGRYYQLKDRNRAIISKGWLRFILSKYINQRPYDIRFGLTINKKPFVTNIDNLHFNTSHSGNWIIIAIASTELGADIEFVNHKFGYNDVLDDNFSIDEISYINKDTPVDRFFKLWTRKEAITKASGKGLEEDLKLIPCLDGDRFANANIICTPDDLQVSSFKVEDHYMASVATDTLKQEIRFWEADFTQYTEDF